MPSRRSSPAIRPLRPARLPAAALPLLVVLVVLTATPTGPIRADVSETDLKAAIVFKLLDFVTWADDIEELRLCIYGETRIEKPLREAGIRRAAGRDLNIDRIAISSDAASCHVVFVAAQEEWREASLRELLRHDGVLTVSDGEAFLCHGGMIRLALRRGRPKIAVNASTASARHIHISSKLHELGEPWTCSDESIR